MSAVATREREAAGGRDRAPTEAPAERLFEPEGPTLEVSVLSAWHELRSGGRTACPVCGGELSAGSGCTSCGSDLS
jgi:hypothetical protein